MCHNSIRSIPTGRYGYRRVLLLKMLNQLDKIRVTQWLPARKLYTLNTDNVHDLVNQGDSGAIIHHRPICSIKITVHAAQWATVRKLENKTVRRIYLTCAKHGNTNVTLPSPLLEPNNAKAHKLANEFTAKPIKIFMGGRIPACKFIKNLTLCVSAIQPFDNLKCRAVDYKRDSTSREINKQNVI